MEDIRFNLKWQDKVAILKISGQLFSKTVAELDKNMDEIIEKTDRIILDFSLLEYICSAALGTLVSYFNQASQTGGKVVVIGVNKKIKKILEIIGFPKLIEQAETIEEALDIFE